MCLRLDERDGGKEPLGVRTDLKFDLVQVAETLEREHALDELAIRREVESEGRELGAPYPRSCREEARETNTVSVEALNHQTGVRVSLESGRLNVLVRVRLNFAVF